MAVNEIGKIITTKSPTALYDSITLSVSPLNVENLIVFKSSSQKELCFHTVSTYWNSLIKRLSIPNPNIIFIVIPMLKQKLKKFLLNRPEIGDPLNWLQENNDI